MKQLIIFSSLSFLITLFSACKTNPLNPSSQDNSNIFTLTITPSNLTSPFSVDTLSFAIDKNLREVSGILYSRINDQLLWVEEDGGNGQFLHLYSTYGHHVKKINLLKTEAQDAEDIAYGPDKNGNYSQLFLADIGDNKNKRSTVNIYTFNEPEVSDTSLTPDTMTAVKKIRLKYPGSSENAEALLVDPLTNRIYIFSKQSSVSHVYTLDFPYDYDNVNILKHVGDMNIRFQKVTAADISRDGMNVLLKTLDYIFYWKRKPGEDLDSTFARQPALLPYQPEVQGEAVSWGKTAPDEYFTFSEESDGVIPKLFLYQSK